MLKNFKQIEITIEKITIFQILMKKQIPDKISIQNYFIFNFW